MTRLKLVESLSDLSYDLSLILARELPGEGFAVEYKLNKKLFSKLVSREFALTKAIRGFQKQLSLELPLLIDWNAFRMGDKAALLAYDFMWDQKTVELRKLLLKELEPTVELGFAYAKDRLNKDVDLEVSDEIVQKKLFKRADFAATSIMDTLKERLGAKLKTAIKVRTINGSEIISGFDFPSDIDEDLSSGLVDTTDSQGKANGIGATEIIAAVALGFLLFSREAGAKTKVWRTVGDGKVDSECAALDGQRASIDGTFDSGGEEVDAPPLHVNCRCALDVDDQFLRPLDQGTPYRSTSASPTVAPRAPKPGDLAKNGEKIFNSMSKSNVQSELIFNIDKYHKGLGVGQTKAEEFLRQHFDLLKVQEVPIKNLRWQPGMFVKETDYIQLLMKAKAGKPPTDWTINEYTKMLSKTEAPPIIIMGNEVLDGLHRVETYIRAGRKVIRAIDITPFLNLPVK